MNFIVNLSILGDTAVTISMKVNDPACYISSMYYKLLIIDFFQEVTNDLFVKISLPK